jgi:tripartite-type tricarboxylate transporter receptor subunit TctC
LVARVIAEKLGARLGNQVVVENRSGAGGAVGTESVARSAPDGATILFHTAAVAIEPAMRRDLNYDVRRDLVPVTQIAETPFVIMVNPSLPVRTIPELIAYGKAHPGALNYGTSGTGSSVHLSLAWFSVMAGIQMTHVPYRGAAPSLVALSSNEVQIVLDTVSISKPLADTGRARGVAAASAGRSPAWPELPTVRESGLSDYEVNIWHGIFAPAATPAPIVAKLNAELRAVMAAEGMQAWANQLGFRIVTSSPADFHAFFLAQVAHWGTIVKQTGIQLD